MILEKLIYADTHTHLDFPNFDEDREEVILRAEKGNVRRIINVGTCLETSRLSIKLAENHISIWSAVGVHPNDSQQLPLNWLSDLRKLAYHPKAISIGEIGLDFYRDHSPKDIQISTFEKQIRLANELSLPMIIHIRQAHDTAKKILENIGYFCGVFHAFSGDETFLKWALDKGFYIGFGGPITFKNFKKTEIVKAVPLKRIFSETDSPFLSPHPKRGKRNEPCNIPIIIDKIAELHSVDSTEVAWQIVKNAEKLFKIPAYSNRYNSKTMGQNFLVNVGIAKKFVDVLGEHNVVLEIGPGHGMITKLLAKRFTYVIAIELDEELARELSNKYDNVKVIHVDFLKFTIDKLRKYYGEKPVIVGNIPYSITFLILFHLLVYANEFIKVILGIQKEVADRLVAKPGCKEYGIPTVVLSRKFHIRKLFDVMPGSFRPIPNVNSTVVELVPRENVICPEIDDATILKLLKIAFKHRRKKLLNNLKPFYKIHDLEALGLSSNVRAENLSVEKFCELCKLLCFIT